MRAFGGVWRLVAVGAFAVIAAARSSSASAAPISTTATVVLIANLAEAEEACGCGAIIQEVRAAAKRGIATKEIDTRTDQEGAKKYRALVVPCVLFLDAAGHELRRYEGESGDALKQLKADLDALVAPKK